jgi:hypothetical protein
MDNLIATRSEIFRRFCDPLGGALPLAGRDASAFPNVIRKRNLRTIWFTSADKMRLRTGGAGTAMYSPAPANVPKHD